MKSRPTEKDVQSRDIAKTITKQVIAWLNKCGDNSDTEQEIEDILTAVINSIGFHGDGYEFAKELEDNYYFSPDSELVNILDAICYNISDAKNELIKQWIKENNITPMLNVNDKVTVEITRNLTKTICEGKIIRINENTATYTVCIPELGHVKTGCGNLGRIIPFQDVELLNNK